MQKGRHWVLVVSNTHLYRLYRQTCGFVSGITARQRGLYWLHRYLPAAQNHSPANQIVNESLPIFLDSAVRFITAIRKTKLIPMNRSEGELLPLPFQRLPSVSCAIRPPFTSCLLMDLSKSFLGKNFIKQ
jgi:hypothetical protein